MGFDAIQDILQSNLRGLLPVMFIVLALVGNILFAGKSILPNWTIYEDLTSQIENGQAALEAMHANDDPLEEAQILQQQVDGARRDLDAAAASLLTEDQANQMLNRLFDYASESGVDITNLQAQQATQAAATGGYDTRVFRLQVAGDIWSLFGFIAHVREATIPSVSMRALSIASDKSATMLTLEIWFYTSLYASGDVLLDLPEINLPVPEVNIVTTVTPVPAPEATPSEIQTTTVTYLAAPLPLNLLYTDSFNSGVTYVWDMGDTWTFVNEGDGQALQVTNDHTPVTFRHGTLLNAAVQIRVKLNEGSARLNLRQSDAGSYTAIVSPGANEVRLYRGDILVQTAALPLASDEGWYTVQLSAIDDIVRLVINNVETIAIRDLAALPPGSASFELVGNGTLRVDDFMLWTLPHTDSTGG